MVDTGIRMDCAGAKSRPRDRIVDTATALFRKHGIRGIGVDAIAEAAGTNKMTLYRHFGSKDQLVAECLQAKALEAEARWADLDRDHPGDPLGQLRSWVEMVSTFACSEGQGCDFANAAVELHEDNHPARAVIEAFKIEQRNRLCALCRSAGADDPDLLADSLSLLLEGARVSRQSVGPEGPSSRFVKAAESMIAAAIRSRVQDPAA